MPKLEQGAYPQMHYESINKETYDEMVSKLGKLSFGRIKGEKIVIERFCDNDVCEIDFTDTTTDTEEIKV